MFKLTKTAALGLLCTAAFAAVPTQAAPYLGPGIQLLEDQDAESIIRCTGGGDNVPLSCSTVEISLTPNEFNPNILEPDPTDPNNYVTEGDLFAGVIKIQETKIEPDGDVVSTDGDAETFTGIFLIQAESCVSTGGACDKEDGSNDDLLFAPVGQEYWDEIYGASGVLDISTAFDVSDINSSGSGLAAGTMAFLFNGVVYDDAVIPAADLSTSATSFVSGGSLQYEFGFTGAPTGTPFTSAGEFWRTDGEDAAFFGGAIGNSAFNRLALNVTRQWAGPDLLPHNHRLFSDGDPNFLFDTQLQGFGNFTGLGEPWALTTDTDFWINSVPAPGSLGLLALGLLGLGYASRRKA